MASCDFLVCPVCSGTLVRSVQSYSCTNRHNFDLSKEGYLSLLHGRGNYQEIGDDKRMVQARVRVHSLSPYRELGKEIAGYCPKAASRKDILDIGCGDGFFLQEAATLAAGSLKGVGIDISKSALGRAAKAYPGLFFVRADAAHAKLPFADGSFGIVLSVFAPRPIDEIRRVLASDGSWLIVTAPRIT